MTKSKNEMRKEFLNTFVFKIYPNYEKDEKQAAILNQYWREQFGQMADYWLNIIDQQQDILREKVEGMKYSGSKQFKIPKNGRGLVEYYDKTNLLMCRRAHNQTIDDILTLLNKEK